MSTNDPAREQPTTEEALPGVDLEPDEEAEEEASRTIGPEAADELPEK